MYRIPDPMQPTMMGILRSKIKNVFCIGHARALNWTSPFPDHSTPTGEGHAAEGMSVCRTLRWTRPHTAQSRTTLMGVNVSIKFVATTGTTTPVPARASIPINPILLPVLFTLLWEASFSYKG